MTSEQKWVYTFFEGTESMRNLLGGKGAGSAEMTRAGMPVPPGFTITTEACLEYFRIPGNLPEELADELTAEIEKDTTGDFPRALADRIQDALSKRQGDFPPGMADQLRTAMASIEAEKGAKFGDADVEIDLVLLVTQCDDVGQVVLPLPQAHHRRHTVVRVHLKPPDKVVTHRHGVGEVLDVPVGVDDAWHDGLA